jgi:hypothetical protein
MTDRSFPLSVPSARRYVPLPVPPSPTPYDVHASRATQWFGRLGSRPPVPGPRSREARTGNSKPMTCRSVARRRGVEPRRTALEAIQVAGPSRLNGGVRNRTSVAPTGTRFTAAFGSQAEHPRTTRYEFRVPSLGLRAKERLSRGRPELGTLNPQPETLRCGPPAGSRTRSSTFAESRAVSYTTGVSPSVGAAGGIWTHTVLVLSQAPPAVGLPQPLHRAIE